MSDSFKCYNLPYGLVGILGWISSILKVIHSHHIRDYSEVKWKYEKLQRLYVIIYSFMIIATTIHTCISCQGKWFMLLISLGQLSGWGFTIISRGISFDNRDANAADEHRKKLNREKYEKFWKIQIFLNYTGIIKNERLQVINNEIERIDKTERRKRKLNSCIKYFGGIIVLLSSICGWIGTTGLFISLCEIKGKIVIWTCIIYIVAVISIIILIALAIYRRCFYCMVFAAYFAVSLHMLETCVLLIIANGHWIGIETKIKIVASIIFTTGHILSFVEEFLNTLLNFLS